MRVKVCYPCPGPTPIRPYAGWLDHWRLSGLEGVRSDLHHQRPDAFGLLAFIREHGLQPMPIIELDGDPSEVAGFTGRLGRDVPWVTEIEIGNEPLSLTNLSPQRYAEYVIPIATAMREANPDCRIYIACEHVSSDGRTHEHWTQTAKRVPLDLWDGAAIHSYRGEHAHFTKFRDRQDEFDRIRAAVPAAKSIVCTETGYPAANEDWQAEQIATELEIQKALGVELVCLYAHEGPHGLFEAIDAQTLRARPAAMQVAQFVNRLREAEEKGPR